MTEMPMATMHAVNTYRCEITYHGCSAQVHMQMLLRAVMLLTVAKVLIAEVVFTAAIFISMYNAHGCNVQVCMQMLLMTLMLLMAPMLLTVAMSCTAAVFLTATIAFSSIAHGCNAYRCTCKC